MQRARVDGSLCGVVSKCLCIVLRGVLLNFRGEVLGGRCLGSWGLTGMWGGDCFGRLMLGIQWRIGT